jgi:hypothetical protein
LKYRLQLALSAEWFAFFYQHSVLDRTIEAKEEKKKNVSFHFAGF